jgi:hypothetical protein
MIEKYINQFYFLTKYASSSFQLQRAMDKLWNPIINWIHAPNTNGKQAIFDAYDSLTDLQKTLVNADVLAAFEKAHGTTKVVAFRYKNIPRHIGGMSLTTEEPTYLSKDKYVAFLVHANDVLAHWAQELSPLGGRAFGHEKELILKPTANPKQLT